MAEALHYDIAFSGDHPRSSLAASVVRLTPEISDHCARVFVSPLHSIKRLFERLFCCSLYVDHLQFSLSYPRSLFTRSIVNPSGHSPISAKKLSKDSHSSQTAIPRPPYLGYAGTLGFVQRVFIPHQMLCVRDLLKPCRRFLATIWSVATSTAKQPQDLDVPFLRDCAETDLSAPHSQRQAHLTCLDAPSVARCKTVHRWKVLPVKSIKFGIQKQYNVLDVLARS